MDRSQGTVSLAELEGPYVPPHDVRPLSLQEALKERNALAQLEKWKRNKLFVLEVTAKAKDERELKAFHMVGLLTRRLYRWIVVFVFPELELDLDRVVSYRVPNLQSRYILVAFYLAFSPLVFLHVLCSPLRCSTAAHVQELIHQPHRSTTYRDQWPPTP